ncbi:MAG: ATPase [Myxococcales bacterium]|nr:ATPase [Myxococcales bacterium]
MARRGIREFDGKRMLAAFMKRRLGDSWKYDGNVALISPDTDMESLRKNCPWISKGKLVAKPDQLFGKRGKHGLLLVNSDFDGVKKWIGERMGKPATIGKVSGELTHFLVEPFTPHSEDEEYYVAIKDERECDVIYFSVKGGIFVEENWDKVIKIEVPVLQEASKADILAKISDLKKDKELVAEFIAALHAFYAESGFSYLEINPFTVSGGAIVPLDLVAKVDDAAAFDCRKIWGELEFPPSFGTSMTAEERFVKHLDDQSGASLKLTILNPEGRVWTMVAGGGASVIYADTVCDIGFSKELANYGEYSGDPSKELTYQYAKTILDLMTRKKDPRGKVLLIGGGIANFTDVAATFTGIIQALKEFKDKLIENDVRVFVRRGGPNYKEGLSRMRELGQTLGIPIEVYGPETHMTRIVSLALSEAI